jgi:hypothetical protein
MSNTGTFTHIIIVPSKFCSSFPKGEMQKRP